LLDAAPVKANGNLGRIYMLSDLLSPVASQIAEANNVDHWQLVEFGKGKGLLAHAFRKKLGTLSAGSTIIADSSSEETRAVLEVLLETANTVVRGLR
jgi:hypothetical protein